MSDSEILEVTIQKVVPGGYGLAYARELTIFVPLAAEGDRLKVKIYKRNAQTAFATIVEIIEPSKERREPLCRYFGECGGCDFQHLAYSIQLEKKVQIVRDCLQRIGKIHLDEIPIIESEQEWSYRLRAQWHVDLESRKIGYFKRNSNEVVDVETCPILTPRLQEFLCDFRSQIIRQSLLTKGKIHVEVATDGKNVSVFSKDFPSETDQLSIKVGAEEYLFDSRVFFQANRFLLQRLIETALDDFSGEMALDLYCGVGFFTLPLARRFRSVIAVEESPEAVRFAVKNAEIQGIKNVKFFARKVSEFLGEKTRNLVKELKDLDFVLLDPPRTGMEKKVVEELIRLEPKQICYVSCDPATLARDLRKLNEKYEIVSVIALDLFPQTHHVESVVKLRKK
ncbi:MAG: class I SAM-dependent RNA methyltransferase [Acidobacteria bacterium]|jgi:23S rRNA (uracil1939-C5)-methyltransferase|nr:MAG: class I SAM-dependent RNA methyltransferase [Acidobacteriota bacterium]GIU81287.1 MAG: 23S rRNA (uracil-5-)-methyltransferase RumA [Pyrinomonadaceae bacterium]